MQLARLVGDAPPVAERVHQQELDAAHAARSRARVARVAWSVLHATRLARRLAHAFLARCRHDGLTTVAVGGVWSLPTGVPVGLVGRASVSAVDTGPRVVPNTFVTTAWSE
jgi:hypothetical protein